MVEELLVFFKIRILLHYYCYLMINDNVDEGFPILLIVDDVEIEKIYFHQVVVLIFDLNLFDLLQTLLQELVEEGPFWACF